MVRIRNSLLSVALYLFSYGVNALDTLPKVIKLATTNWCPYACENLNSSQGMVYEYVQYIGEQLGTRIEIVFLPWSRAVKSVESGVYDGLLSAIKTEAPSLKFTTTPTMEYQVCFFNRMEDVSKYHGIDSLKSKRLGAIASYGYGEPIDSYIAETENTERVIKLTGSAGVSRLISLLNKKRIDLFVEDKNVLVWNIKNQSRFKRNQLKEAGCLPKTPFFIAVNPKVTWSDSFIDALNTSLKLMANKQYLNNEIKPKYLRLRH